MFTFNWPLQDVYMPNKFVFKQNKSSVIILDKE